MKRNMDKSENYDLQNELERKFNELFGTLDEEEEATDNSEDMENDERAYEEILPEEDRRKIEEPVIPADVQSIIDRGDFSDDQIRYIKKIPWRKLKVPSIDIDNELERPLLLNLSQKH